MLISPMTPIIIHNVYLVIKQVSLILVNFNAHGRFWHSTIADEQGNDAAVLNENASHEVGSPPGHFIGITIMTCFNWVVIQHSTQFGSLTYSHPSTDQAYSKSYTNLPKPIGIPLKEKKVQFAQLNTITPSTSAPAMGKLFRAVINKVTMHGIPAGCYKELTYSVPFTNDLTTDKS